MEFKFDLTKQLKVSATGSIEWRDGARPWGGTFNYPGVGQVTETVEPVDYQTFEANLDLAYSNRRIQGNVSYNGSFFRNNNQSLTWENPGLTPFPTFAPEQGRFALAPDNDYHNVRGNIATTLPWWRSRITGSLSYSLSRQNDALIAPTITTGTIGAPANPINLDLWNNPGSLSTDSANAELESLDLHTKVTLKPLSEMNLSGEFRYRDQDNKTEYTALNLLTGEYGYIALNGGLDGLAPAFSAIYDPARPGSRVRIRNVPFDKDTLSFRLGAQYRIANRTKVGAFYERDEFQYSHREVDEVVDSRYRLQLTQRNTGLGTVRLSYEYVDRDGDDYNPNPYEPFYSSSLPDFTPRFTDGDPPHTLSAMRKYDIADKGVHKIDAKVNTIIFDHMDIALSGSYEHEDYDADFGLNATESATATVK